MGMPILRLAELSDVKGLITIEEACFKTDRMSERSFKRFIERGKGRLLVAEGPDAKNPKKKALYGYGLIFFHKGTSLSRLYSLAVSPEYRKHGVAKLLMKGLEKLALDGGCTYLRLEVAETNEKAKALYHKLGYRRFDYKLDYYEDHTPAECFEKKIRTPAPKVQMKVRYYAQTTDFTCGPACLLMAMHGHDKRIKQTPDSEIQIWREATTIFMTSGHGGCGPHGLALAAFRRGFKVELSINHVGTLFRESVRQESKKEVITLVQAAFEKELRRARVRTIIRDVSWQKIKEVLGRGGIPLVLISAYRLTETKEPHWVVITGIEDNFIYFHDPDIDDDQRPIDNINIPVRRDEFEQMARYGSKQLKSMIAIYPRPKPKPKASVVKKSPVKKTTKRAAK